MSERKARQTRKAAPEIDFDAARPPTNASGEFDLDSFAPAEIRFRLGGRSWRLPGDPDVEIVAKMLRIETAVRDGDPEDAANAIVEGREILALIAKSDVADRKTAVVPVSLAALDEIRADFEGGKLERAERRLAAVCDSAEAYEPATSGGLRVGVGELLTLFSLVTGGTSVATHVADAIRAEAAGGGGDGEDEEGGDPLASEQRSSGESETSGTTGSGRRSTSAGSRSGSSRRTSRTSSKS